MRAASPGSVSPPGGEHQFGDCAPRVIALTICLGPGRRRLCRKDQHRKVSAIPKETKSVGVTFLPLRVRAQQLSVAWRRTLIRGFPLTGVPPIVHPGPDRRRFGRVGPQGLIRTERSWLGSLLFQGFIHRTPSSFAVCPCTFPTGRARCRQTSPADVPEAYSTSRHRPCSGLADKRMRDCRACPITSQVGASTRGDDPFRGAPVKLRVSGSGRPRRRRSGRRLVLFPTA